jgi:hypothetical protein
LVDITLDSLDLEQSGELRTPGCHMSDVLRTMQQDVDPGTFGKPGSPFLPDATTHLRFAMGFNFERVMEIAFASRRMDIVRIGEVEVDGIIGSPDGVDMNANPPAVTELKLTWKSTKGTPWPCDEHEFIREGCDQCTHSWAPKHMWWIMQMKAYCYMLGLRHATLRALFVNGSYSNMAPTLRGWSFEWTQEELAAFWQQLKRQAYDKGLL